MEVTYVNMLLDFFALIMLSVIWFIDVKSNVVIKNKKIFKGLQITCSTCLGSDAVAYLLSTYSGEYVFYLSVFANCVYYVSQGVFCWLWFLYVYGRLPNKNLSKHGVLEHLFSLPMITELLLILFVNPFTGIIYYFDENNQYIRNTEAFFYPNLVILSLYVFGAVALLIWEIHLDQDAEEKTRTEIVLILAIAPISMSILQNLFYGISLQWATVAMVIYMLYEIEARKYLEDKQRRQVELEAEINRNKISVMMSQIQPHFLYNTLTTIRALVAKDPQQAQEVITRFSTYLRTNMDSMNLTTPVEFTKELEHTKTYALIEQLRFPDLQVIYDIQDTKFRLPALTVQPMVENAIKHGIRMKDTTEGGVVIVRTFFDGVNHVVQISDNGVGFSSAKPVDNTRSHIGLQNTKKRIEDMMHGAFVVNSEPGLGTTISFIIPENKSE